MAERAHETCEACNVTKDKGKDCDDVVCSQCTNTVHGNLVEREILNNEKILKNKVEEKNKEIRKKKLDLVEKKRKSR